MRLHTMKQSPDLLFIAVVVSAEVLACGHRVSPEPSATTSVTSVTVEARTAERGPAPIGGAGEDLVCLTSGNEPVAPARAPVSARPAKPKPRVALAPGTKAKSALAEAIADSVARNDVVGSDGDEDEVPLVAVPTEVKTTSAIVPRAEPDPRAPLRVAFDNRLPSGYRLARARILVDGAVTYDAPSTGSVRVAPGDHVVEVILDYRLKDSLFTSAGDYGLELRSKESVKASSTPIVLVAAATPEGGVTTAFDKRARVTWRRFPE
jgi:hypothetical protein